MRKDYDHNAIEKKWQSEWTKKKAYKTKNSGKKYYVLDMFPYPSGVGLHVGHPKGYIGSDVFARFKRMQGHNVLHPMGYDAFGLPAEQYALEHNINPRQAVQENVKTFERQLSIIGLSYDWERKVNTTDPEFYRWTQWIFLKIYKSWYNKSANKAETIETLVKKFEKSGTAGVNAVTDNTENFSAKEWKLKTPKEKQDMLMKYRLAYEGYSEVNWCEKLGTVLANDEVVESSKGPVSERGGYPVVKKEMRQWFLRITAYADRLLSGLSSLNWSENIKEIQKNWIGKSEGAEINFDDIKVFTTRPDTIFGATFLAIAGTQNKFTGKYVTNPATKEKIPVWEADYVYADYGTGAVMGVPAHDERDFEFAKKHNLPIRQVIMPYHFDADNPPKKDKKDTKREVVHVILRNPKNKTVLLQFLKHESWGNKKPVNFIIGGTEDWGSQMETALMEIKEETGYVNVKFIEKVPLESTATFYAAHKDVNRYVHAHPYVFDLVNEEKVEITEDEYFTKDTHEMKWVPYDQVGKLLTFENNKEQWNYVQSGGFAIGSAGILTNCGKFDGMNSEKAKNEITKFVGGKVVIKYKMRDAVFARQRYWGEPIPLIHDKDGMIREVPERQLPLKLPDTKSYMPTGTGEGPLANVSAWKKKGYETNTMPGWAGSSWYFLRYMDPRNKKAFADKKMIKYWKNVDMYVGGAEHATGHLLYSRFWHKFLKDYGLVVTEEPFQTLRNQGMILGSDNRKMSKRWGNVVNPNDVVKNYGADTLRVYEMFMGPFEASLPWSTDNIIGSRRFLDKVWKFASKLEVGSKNQGRNAKLESLLHKTIKKVTEDIENFAFNTAVSSMMILVNEMEKEEVIHKKDFEVFLKLLSPFAPHITEEMWRSLGHKTLLVLEKWPKAIAAKMKDTEVTFAIQVNGRVRGLTSLAPESLEMEVLRVARSLPEIEKWLLGKQIQKVFFVPKKLINIITN